MIKLYLLRIKSLISCHSMKRFYIVPVLLIALTTRLLYGQEAVLPHLFWFEIGGGISYLTQHQEDATKSMTMQGMPDELANDYYSSLRTGYHLKAELRHAVNGPFSMGLQYRFFHSKASVYSTFDPQDGIHLYYGEVSERIFVNYLGADLVAQNIFHGHAVKINPGISAGLSFYRDENVLILSPYLIKGKSFAFEPSLEMEIPVTRSISVAIAGSWYFSRLRKVSVDDGTNTEDYNFSIDLTCGIIVTL
jgi:hypothetical protein